MNEASRKGDGARLRAALEQAALGQILDALRLENALLDIHVDAVRRMPSLALKLGVRLSTTPELKEIVETNPLVFAAAAASRWADWGHAAEDILTNEPEALYHFLALAGGREIDVAGLLPLLASCPFWAQRAARLNETWAPALKRVPVQLDAENPYQRLHYLVTHPLESCDGAWGVLFSDPVTLVLAANWLHHRGFPWNLLPLQGLGPREAYNLLAAWKGAAKPPPDLWLNLADDPEWLVAAWRLPGAQLPKDAAAASLFDRCAELNGDSYVFGDTFAAWMRKNAPVKSEAGGRSGGDSPEQEQ